MQHQQLMGAMVQAYAEISIGLTDLQGYIGERRRFDERLAEAIRAVPLPPQAAAVSGGGLLIASASNVLGPNTGYAWAVSRVTAGGLGAADTVSVYRGPAAAATVSPNNLLNVLTGAAPSWYPGRAGCIMNYGDTLVLAGTGLTSSQVTLTGEVIIMESWLLPHYLL
jgi:hypothetical protein